MPKKVIEKVPTGSERNEWLLKHLSAVDAGEDIPYFKTKDNDFLYFEKGEVNKKTGQIRYGLVSLTKKKARNARILALKQKRMPSIELYEKIFGFEKGQEIFEQEQEKLNLKYKNPDPYKYDIDHLGSKKNLYPELARNLNPQILEFNRQEGARKLTPTQENALRVVPNDLETSILLQGPELTQKQTDQVMGRIEGGKTGGLSFEKGGVRINRKQLTALAATGVTTYSALGSAASAVETAGRIQLAQESGNPLDYVQAGLSGTSLAGDTIGLFPPAGPVGEVVSTVADVANIGIDTARDPEPLVNVYNKIKEDPLNELEYAGKQMLGGLKKVAGAIIFGF